MCRKKMLHVFHIRIDINHDNKRPPMLIQCVYQEEVRRQQNTKTVAMLCHCSHQTRIAASAFSCSPPSTCIICAEALPGPGSSMIVLRVPMRAPPTTLPEN